MMGDRRERIRHSGHPMRVRDRAERGLRRRPSVDLPPCRAGQRRVVLGGDLHCEVMRMLTIVDLLAVTLFARGQQVRVAATANRPRLETEHATESHMAASDATPCHTHYPVDASHLVGAAIARIMEKLQE